MTLCEESRRYDARPSPALSCYTGTGHDGARGSGTRLRNSDTSGRKTSYIKQRGGVTIETERMLSTLDNLALPQVTLKMMMIMIHLKFEFKLTNKP